MNRLSARGAATAKPGKHADGGGLWLQVTPTGARAWVFRYERAGDETFMGLGPLHTVSLAQARQDALEARQLLRAGIDPLEHRRAKLASRSGIPTFREEAAAFIAENRAAWKNPKHADQWTNTLETYAHPFIGAKPVNTITTEDLLDVLRPIWTTKTETASRVRQRIESVLDAARVKGQREGENPARWRGHLAKLLPKPTAVRQVKHFAALPYAELPAFMVKLRGELAIGARALEFLILTVARTNMVTKAKRDELHGDLWTVPKERMKAKRAHTIPLSARALELAGTEGEWLFPGDRKKPHISNATMDAMLERMGYGHVTVHGFRSSFKDWASETTTFANEVSESALAHVIKDKAEAAYRRGALLEKRRELMDAWAAYLEANPKQSILSPETQPNP